MEQPTTNYPTCKSENIAMLSPQFISQTEQVFETNDGKKYRRTRASVSSPWNEWEEQESSEK